MAINWKKDNDDTMCHHDVIVNFFWRYFVSLVKICYWSKFHVNIFTGSGVMTIYCIRDWPEVWKSEIPASEFCPVSGDWGKLGIANLAWMSLMKCYWMLQNASTVSELLKENQQGLKLPPPPLQIRINAVNYFNKEFHLRCLTGL